MRLSQSACREPAGSYNRLLKVLSVFEHKTQYLSVHDPYTTIVVFWHINNMPHRFRRVKFVIIPHVCIAAILSWWCHLMETFFTLLVICAGNLPVTQRPATRSFDVFFDLAWTNGWVNNCDASGLRRYWAHYDVTVVVKYCSTTISCLL